MDYLSNSIDIRKSFENFKEKVNEKIKNRKEKSKNRKEKSKNKKEKM